MDANRFDHLTRWVSAGGTRRRMLAVLLGLPLGSVLAVFLGDADLAAKRRKPDRQRGSRRSAQDNKRVGGDNHKHERRRRKHRNKGNRKRKHTDNHTCTPESVAQTCDGRCGTVENTCQQVVDCGPCACQPACPACQHCDEPTTTCQPDPDQVGDACGDGQVCQADGRCACQGANCGGCRACEDGRCVIDATIVCTAQDQCHVAGVCDSQTGACTNPLQEDGTSCDDGDPCTRDDACQGGVCTGGSAKDCSAEADDCNDGACRASDGVCIKQPKANGTSCNADNDHCSTGDSCQGGVCTSGAGVDCSTQSDVCNTGVCQASDGACVKQPKGNGTPCGSGRQCQGGVCEAVACLAVNAVCDPQDDQCCDTTCTSGAACAGTGQARCCRGDGDDCASNCDCCDGVCVNGVCCQPNRQCNGSSECCDGFACIGNVCVTPCGTQHAVCGAIPCCDGFRCVDGECWPDTCLAPAEQCSASNQCCPDGAFDCRTTVDSSSVNVCCRPYDQTCQETYECCDNTICGPQGKCCLGGFYDPDRGGEQARGCVGRESECCPGRRCSRFSDICCLEKGQPVAADRVTDCCHFTRENGVCSCHTSGEACSAPFGPTSVSSCCDGLICFDGVCEPPCLFPGQPCGSGSLSCCGALTCQQGFCL